MEEYLRLDLHREYARRMEEEHSRQNHRINELEGKVEEIGALTASVASLAKSVEQMVEEQKAQGERLKALEGRDGEKWRQVTGYVLTTIISIVVGFVCAKIGIF